MSDLKDKSLIEKIRSGDVSAFTHLVEKYREKVLSLSFRITGDMYLAEDAAQNTFVKVFHSLDKFRGDSAFGTWLYRIAFNTALSLSRKEKNRGENVDIENAEAESDVVEDGFARLEAAERVRFLDMALLALKGEDAALLNLYYKEEMPLDEIGLVLGISHGNARIRVMRARKKLLDELEKILKLETKQLL